MLLGKATLTAAILLVLLTALPANAEGTAKYACFQFGGKTALFQSADKTLSASDRTRAGELADLYRTISGKDWTTDREAQGGNLEFAFLDALAEQGWEVTQVTHQAGDAIYLLRKDK